MPMLKTLRWVEQHGYGIECLVEIASILSLCLIIASSAVAQQNIHTPPSSPDVTPVIRVSSQFVILDALVENRKTGNLVGNLEASDFQVEEDKDPQNISYFSHDQLPLSVVFLFDLTDTVQPILKPLAQGL